MSKHGSETGGDTTLHNAQNETVARFLVHRHATGRSHYDLRVIQNLDGAVRSWSLLKEPPVRPGERRLAIEREVLTAAEIGRRHVSEEAFGTGKVHVWDRGEAVIHSVSSERLVLTFQGDKMAGRYEMRRTNWYPGNRWMLEKSPDVDANLT